jgi:hypothetical protein
MFTTKKEIIDWLNLMEIKNYTINDDLTVNAKFVNINGKELTEIPVQFNEVDIFDCEDNKLISLKGSPYTVITNFKCSNNLLITLDHSPISVGRSFYCDDNKLTTLKGVPQHIGNVFSCQNNQLTSLEFCPSKVLGNFYCCNNAIEDFKFAPEYVGKNLYARFNPIKSFKEALTIELEEVLSHAVKDMGNTLDGFTEFYKPNGTDSYFFVNLTTKEIRNILLYNSINSTEKNNKSLQKRNKI